MKNLFVLFIFIIPTTNQLSCFFNCTSIRSSTLEPFQHPSNKSKCSNNTQATNCYGQLLTYYQGKGHREYVSYTLGPCQHVAEKEIEELVEKNNFKAILYFFFVIDSFDDEEVVISTHIICQNYDNCALNYIEDLINFNRRKINPITYLRPLLHNPHEFVDIICYNSETRHAEKCPVYQRPTCFINNTDRIEQECYSDSNTKLEYVFMIILSEKNSLKKVLELIICNRDGCNEESILKEVETIVYNYTLDELKITFNRSNQLKIYLFICLILQLILYNERSCLTLFEKNDDNESST